MPHRTRNTRETWTTVTNPSLAILVSSVLAVVLVPIMLTYLVGHLTLAGGLLIGVGLSQLLGRLNGRNVGTHQQSSPSKTREPPVLAENLHSRQQATARTSSD